MSGWEAMPAIEIGAFLHQLLRVCERDQPQLAAHRVDPVGAFDHGDVAVGGDGDVLVGRLEYDRAGGAEHRMARSVDELAQIVDLHCAVAGVALAGRGLHDEETTAVDRNIERVFGLLGGALREILVGAAVLHVADAAVGRRAKLSSCAPEVRYSSNSERSALKPDVLMLATLLATTSICRSSVTCRESPMRSVFVIEMSPLVLIRERPSQALADQLNHLALPSRGSPTSQRKPCQFGKVRFLRELVVFPVVVRGGNKVLLTMFARQFFPTRRAKERFR